MGKYILQKNRWLYKISNMLMFLTRLFKLVVWPYAFRIKIYNENVKAIPTEMSYALQSINNLPLSVPFLNPGIYLSDP